MKILLLSINFNEMVGAKLNYYQQIIQFLVCSSDAQPHTSLLHVAELSARDREAKSALLTKWNIPHAIQVKVQDSQTHQSQGPILI